MVMTGRQASVVQIAEFAVVFLHLQPHRIDNSEHRGQQQAEYPSGIQHDLALSGKLVSIKIVRILGHIRLGDFAPERFVNPSSVQHDKWQEGRGDHQHDEQGNMRGRGVPDSQ